MDVGTAGFSIFTCTTQQSVTGKTYHSNHTINTNTNSFSMTEGDMFRLGYLQKYNIVMGITIYQTIKCINIIKSTNKNLIQYLSVHFCVHRVYRWRMSLSIGMIYKANTPGLYSFTCLVYI